VTSDLSRNAEFDEFDTQFCPVTWVVTFIPNNKNIKLRTKYAHKNTHTHTRHCRTSHFIKFA